MIAVETAVAPLRARDRYGERPERDEIRRLQLVRDYNVALTEKRPYWSEARRATFNRSIMGKSDPADWTDEELVRGIRLVAALDDVPSAIRRQV